MSVITGISAAGPQAAPAIITPQPGSAPASKAPVTDGQVNPPAVIISLSLTAAASAKATSTLPSLDLNKVDNALSWAAGTNGLAVLSEHVDRTLEIAKFGNAISQRNQTELLGEVAASTSHALSFASNLGIPIQASVSPEAIKNGAAPGTISVGAFSFTNGGSTYSVTPGKDGTLVGTKDGQAWKTWQSSAATPHAGATANVGATAALQALTALNAQKAPTDKPPTGLNLST